MIEDTGILFDIQRNSYVDGPGIRTTVFFKGCNLRCAWCHNPESHAPSPQLMVYSNRCAGCGKCREVCPHDLATCDLCGACVGLCPHHAREICGGAFTAEDVLRTIAKDRRFYDASGGGVTFSGGECMLQIDFLETLLKGCRERGIHTAVDTAGHLPRQSFERILPLTDLFLYDVKIMDSDKHRFYTGVGNELILENLRWLLSEGRRVWIRIPIIPTVNDTLGDMQRIKDFLDDCGHPEAIELLPYHALGEHKRDALGQTPHSFSIPDEETMRRLKAIFS